MLVLEQVIVTVFTKIKKINIFKGSAISSVHNFEPLLKMINNIGPSILKR